VKCTFVHVPVQAAQFGWFFDFQRFRDHHLPLISRQLTGLRHLDTLSLHASQFDGTPDTTLRSIHAEAFPNLTALTLDVRYSVDPVLMLKQLAIGLPRLAVLQVSNLSFGDYPITPEWCYFRFHKLTTFANVGCVHPMIIRTEGVSAHRAKFLSLAQYVLPKGLQHLRLTDDQGDWDVRKITHIFPRLESFEISNVKVRELEAVVIHNYY